MLSDEGKNSVLGVVSCYLALIGYEVDCMCYSRLLSQGSYESNRLMFEELQLTDCITYGTFSEIFERLINTKTRDLRRDIQDILLTDASCLEKESPESLRKKVLLIDEVDVFFAKDYFGSLYTPSTSISHNCIEMLARYVWQNRVEVSYESLTQSELFKRCIQEFPKLKSLLEYNAADMVRSVKSFKHDYIIHDGRIGYVLPEGISHKANFGWKTTFAYLYEKEFGGIIKELPEEFASMSILCCEMSYAELPR